MKLRFRTMNHNDVIYFLLILSPITYIFFVVMFNVRKETETTHISKIPDLFLAVTILGNIYLKDLELTHAIWGQKFVSNPNSSIYKIYTYQPIDQFQNYTRLVYNRVPSIDQSEWDLIIESMRDFVSANKDIEWYIHVNTDVLLDTDQLIEFLKYMQEISNPKTDIVIKSSINEVKMMSYKAFLMSRYAVEVFLNSNPKYEISTQNSLTKICFSITNMSSIKSPIFFPEFENMDFQIKYFMGRQFMSQCDKVDVVPIRDSIFITITNNNMPLFQIQNVFETSHSSDLHYDYTSSRTFCWDDKLPYNRTWLRL